MSDDSDVRMNLLPDLTVELGRTMCHGFYVSDEHIAHHVILCIKVYVQIDIQGVLYYGGVML